MQTQVRLPEGILVPRGERQGRRVWERRIREQMGAARIHLRFPVWEGGSEAEALLEEGMRRLYAYACRKAEECRELCAVVQYRLLWEQGQARVSLQGYVGEREAYRVGEWATLCFAWEGTCPCQGVIFPKKRRK